MIKKLLIKKEERTDVDGRSVKVSSEKFYSIEDPSKDFHCSEGMIKTEDLMKSNQTIKTNRDKEFFILDADFMDSYKRIRKTAQTIPLKDLGFIIAETGLNKKSVVVDTGSGSGGSACFFAQFVKKVYTYDVNDANLKQTAENARYFGLKNIVIKKQDAYEKIPNKNVDMVLLDVPEPWRALNSADKALKTGGFLVTYCPQITQSHQVVNGLSKLGNYIQIKTIEIVERDWKVEGQIVRPRSLSNIHSAFLSVFRKIN